MRADAVQEVFRQRNLSVNGAAQRLDMSREALTKLYNGRDVQLETVEQFARKLRLDVNEWRVRWGYPPVEPQESNADIWTRALADLAREFNKDRIVVNFSGGLERLNELTREELQALIDDQRAELEEEAAGLLDPREDKQGPIP